VSCAFAKTGRSNKLQGGPKRYIHYRYHIQLSQASVFQLNHTYSSNVLFPSFSGSSVQDRSKIVEAYTSLRTQLSKLNNFEGSFQAETLKPDSQ